MADYDDYRPRSSLSWTGDGKSITRTLFIRAADEIEAHNHVDVPQRGDQIDLSETSGEIYPLYVDSVQVDQVANAAGDPADDFLFEVVVVYNPLTVSTPVVDKAAWRVTFRPEKITITNVDEDSDQTHYAPGSGESWWAITTGINETQDGPAGVQIDEMVEVLQVDFWKDPDDVEAFLEDVRTVRNRVNNAALEGPWGSYAAGEAKISGLEVAKNSDDLVTVSVEFSISENFTGIQVKLDNADATVSVDKDGHEYLWVRWVKSVDPDEADPKKQKPKPRRIDAHVATVYDSGDFSVLGITDDLFV